MGVTSKSRPTKRSSAASSSSSSSSSSPYPYTSTISTVIFLALCVLGLWTLTSNTVRSPQSTNRSSIDTAASSLDNKLPGTEDSASVRIPRTGEEAEKQVFEDNPGQLPIDAIKADDNNKDAADTNDKAAKEKTPEDAAAAVLGNEGVEEQVKEKYGEAQVSEKKGGSKENQMDQQGEPGNTNSESEENKLAEKNLKPKDEGIDGEAERKEEQKETNLTSNEDHKTDIKENQTKEDQTDQQVKQVFPQEMKEKDQDQPVVKQDQAQDAVQEKQQDQPLKQEQAQDAMQEKQQDQPLKQESLQEKQPDQQPKQESLQEKQLDQPLKEESLQDTLHEKQQARMEDETKQQELPRRKQDPPKGENMTAESNNATVGSTLTTSVIPKESSESMKSWSTQAKQSENEKERNRMKGESHEESMYGYTWELCNVTTGKDYIPCLDNEKAVKKLKSTRHFQHRERHCPEEPPCLVALPEGYKTPILWPQSRDKVWYHNVPHTMLANFKGHQNWVKLSGEFLRFPGGGTQFIYGALHYINVMQEAVQNISWGKHTRVVLDVGCGVASFGGFLFEKDVLTMSFAPKDEHEAQVQFALERGIPAISAVMGSQRLPFPSRVFDLIHCARCRVPWHEEGGRLLLEVNRMLRPGGYFVWSATPVYRKGQVDRDIWLAMTSLTESMCWELVTIHRDELDLVAAAFFRKPTSNECYEKRKDDNPPMCKDDNDPNAAWYIPLQSCMHRLPVEQNERGSQWPEDWPERLYKPPYWLSSSQSGIYGKPAPQDFERDYDHWKKVVSQLYMNGMGISWSNVRNVMDMRAVYGGFAAALKDVQVWVLNVVNINSPDTLPIIYERGLFGIYHDWCESFSTYPRTYDLLHADHLFSDLKTRCKLVPVMAEVDRIVRPGGKLIVRDDSGTIGELENMLKSLHWEVNLTFSKDQEGILSAQKGNWRPSKY